MFSSCVLFLSFSSPGGRTVCFPFEGRNNGLSIFSPCRSLVLKEACAFLPKPFPSIGALLRREKCGWIDLLGACFSSLSIYELLGWKEGYRDDWYPIPGSPAGHDKVLMPGSIHPCGWQSYLVFGQPDCWAFTKIKLSSSHILIMATSFLHS